MKNKLVLILVLLVLLLAVAACSPAQEPQPFAPQPLDDIIASATVLLASLVGIPAFLSAVLALLEYFGKITPGGSDQVQMLANTVLYIGCFLAVLFGQTNLLAALEHYLGGLAPLLVALLAFLTGGIHSIVQTRRYLNHIRSLYPIRMRATLRL